MRARLISFIVAGFLIGALAGAAILLVTTPRGGQPVQSSGTALVGGPFSLVGADGKTVTDADFRGRYMLVFFGFTHCPDICPAELQVIAQALDKLGDKAKKVVPVFITLDPERDTPQAMADYVKSFGPNFVGLTGSPEAIAAAAKAYRVAYAKVETKEFSRRLQRRSFGSGLSHGPRRKVCDALFLWHRRRRIGGKAQ